MTKVNGLRILDFGCGCGEQSIGLLKKGAFVSGIDISQSYINTAINAASEAGFTKEQYQFKVMDAHNLNFPDNTFDIVVGRGVLHHLDISIGLSQVHRVLNKNGRALFLEPLAANPLLKFFRLLTPKARTKDEKPLSTEDLKNISSNWYSESSYYGVISAPVAMLTSIVLRPFDNNYLLKLSDWLEQKLNVFTFAQPFNQYVLLNLMPKKNKII